MYRLVLKLPFNVTLVHRDRFETTDAAQVVANELPGGFKILPEDEVDLTTAQLIPVKENQTKSP